MNCQISIKSHVKNAQKCIKTYIKSIKNSFSRRFQIKNCIEAHAWMQFHLFKLTNYQPMVRLFFLFQNYSAAASAESADAQAP